MLSQVEALDGGRKEAPPPNLLDAALRSSGGLMRFLLVFEDHPIVGVTLRETMEQSGYLSLIHI